MMELLIQYDRTAGLVSITGVALLSEVGALLGLEAPHYDAAGQSKTMPLIDLARTSRDVARLLDDNYLRAPAHRHLLAELDKRHSDGLSWSGDARVIERTLAPWWMAICGSAAAMRRWRPGIDDAVILASTDAARMASSTDSMNAAGGTAADGGTAEAVTFVSMAAANMAAPASAGEEDLGGSEKVSM